MYVEKKQTYSNHRKVVSIIILIIIIIIFTITVILPCFFLCLFVFFNKKE